MYGIKAHMHPRLVASLFGAGKSIPTLAGNEDYEATLLRSSIFYCASIFIWNYSYQETNIVRI